MTFIYVVIASWLAREAICSIRVVLDYFAQNDALPVIVLAFNKLSLTGFIYLF